MPTWVKSLLSHDGRIEDQIYWDQVNNGRKIDKLFIHAQMIWKWENCQKWGYWIFKITVEFILRYLQISSNLDEPKTNWLLHHCAIQPGFILLCFPGSVEPNLLSSVKNSTIMGDYRESSTCTSKYLRVYLKVLLQMRNTFKYHLKWNVSTSWERFKGLWVQTT